MVEKDNVIREEMKYEGLFDYSSLYSFAHSWLVEDEFGVTEERYSERVGGNKRDIRFDWLAIKEINDYFSLEFKIKFEVKELIDVEAEVDGKMKNMNRGRIKLTVSGVLVRDPKSKWDTSAFSRFVREFYDKHIIPSKVEFMKKMVRSKGTVFKDEIKSFLEITGRREGDSEKPMN